MTGKEWWNVPIEKQVEENKNIRLEDIEALKDWLTKQPHLPLLTDEQLGVFLTACNYSIEQVKRAIEINYTIRTRQPKMFGSRDIDAPEMELAKKYYKTGLLPHKKGHPVVVLGAIRPHDSSLFDSELLMRTAYMTQDLSHLTLGPVPEGYVFLFDMINWTFGHILKCPIPLCATVLKYAQEGSCCKIAGIHFMNGGPVLEKFLTILKPFIKPEIWKIVHVHDKTTGLTEFLEPFQIPKDYDGGSGPSTDELTEESLKKFKEYKEWLMDEVKQRVDEDKRPAGSKPILDEGLQGSFRKLDID